jgi:Suppressor of fused protein (SUFU)
MSDLPAQIERHVRQYFQGHEVMARIWPVGPMKDSHPSFQVLEFAPGPRSALWNYVSIGAADAAPPEISKLEFLLSVAEQTGRAVELVTMTAWYHTRHRLGLGHTMPIGEPWVSGASCDHFLVSRPYPYGPDLELVPIGAEHVHLFWLLPITKEEREYKATHGLEALEKLFDANAIQYWIPNRPTVVFDGTG